MAKWKDFKNWLEKEIVDYDGLQVKIKSEKQGLYGRVSKFNVLTNFMDSLEATLDNNNSYHLFPSFNNKLDFARLFPFESDGLPVLGAPYLGKVYFGKKTNQGLIDKNDYDLLAKLFNDWKKQLTSFNGESNENIGSPFLSSEELAEILRKQKILETENERLRKEIVNVSTTGKRGERNLSEEIEVKKNNLVRKANGLKRKINYKGMIDILLDLQELFARLHNHPDQRVLEITQSQLRGVKGNILLEKNISTDEVETICQLKTELTNLNMELERQWEMREEVFN